MPQNGPADIWTLSDLATPWCVHVVATLRIADHLDAGLSSAEELAEASGAQAEPLGRVMRHLVSVGLFEEQSPGNFRLNDPARDLLDSKVRVGLDLDRFGGRMAHSWSSLLQAVRTGKPAYDSVFDRPFWDDLRAHPPLSESFDELMGPAGHGEPDGEVPLAAGWGEVRTVVDVGGGTGAFLASILRARPEVRGTLVDLPDTVARAGAVFEAAGLSGRATAIGQSFFEPLPPRADVYLSRNVLCDWPDREAIALLSRMAEAARGYGRVVILGGVTPDEEGVSPSLLMLVLVGGKERSLSEFRRLAQEAGLEVVATGRQPSGRFVVECRSMR